MIEKQQKMHTFSKLEVANLLIFPDLEDAFVVFDILLTPPNVVKKTTKIKANNPFKQNNLKTI